MGRIRKENEQLKEENRKLRNENERLKADNRNLRNEKNATYQKLVELNEIRRKAREHYDDLASTIEEAADMCIGAMDLINQEAEKIRNIILNLKGEKENG